MNIDWQRLIDESSILAGLGAAPKDRTAKVTAAGGYTSSSGGTYYRPGVIVAVEFTLLAGEFGRTETRKEVCARVLDKAPVLGQHWCDYMGMGWGRVVAIGPSGWSGTHHVPTCP